MLRKTTHRNGPKGCRIQVSQESLTTVWSRNVDKNTLIAADRAVYKGTDVNKAAALLFVLVLSATLCLILPVQVNATSRTIVVPDDYPTISAAIGNATTGDTVYVKSGIYQESLQITTALSLIGENRDTTIIESPDNSKSVVTINHNNVTIAGFTVQNALGLTSVGIDLWAGASFCNITKNKITKNTDGIRLISSPYNSITGNMVDSNSAIGIFLYGSSSRILGSDYNVIQGKRNPI